MTDIFSEILGSLLKIHQKFNFKDRVLKLARHEFPYLFCNMGFVFLRPIKITQSGKRPKCRVSVLGQKTTS
jgi:hypothetical protein